MNIAAAILAGGASRRMGTPKALLPFPSEDEHGAPLIAHIAKLLKPLFSSIVVVTSSSEIARACALLQTEDLFPGKGPLAGIHAALRHFNPLPDAPQVDDSQIEASQAETSIDATSPKASATAVFCVACDMPHLNLDFISYLLQQQADCDAVVPRRGVYDEPLHALYAPACLPVIERELAREHIGPIDNIFHDLRVRWIEEEEARRFDPDLRLFDNWNTPGDVKKSRGQ